MKKKLKIYRRFGELQKGDYILETKANTSVFEYYRLIRIEKTNNFSEFTEFWVGDKGIQVSSFGQHTRLNSDLWYFSDPLKIIDECWHVLTDNNLFLNNEVEELAKHLSALLKLEKEYEEASQNLIRV